MLGEMVNASYLIRVETARPPTTPTPLLLPLGPSRRGAVSIKTLPVESNQLQPWPAAAGSAAGVISRARRLSRLECTGSAAAGAALKADGDLRRVYETWRWRGHKINFRVEGGLFDGW